MACRRIAFMDRFVVDHVGNIAARSCLTLCDVDGDGEIELVAGSLNGRLSVYKNRQKSPWITVTGLGMISSVAVGDIQNCGKSNIVIITADGSCRIFHHKINQTDVLEEVPASGRRLPCSIVAAVITPFGLGSDSRNKLVCATGTHDRAVYVYELREQSKEGDVSYQLWKWDLKTRTVFPHLISSIHPFFDHKSQENILAVGQRENTFALLKNDGEYELLNCLNTDLRDHSKDPESASPSSSRTQVKVLEDVLIAGLLPCEKTGNSYLTFLTTDGRLYYYDTQKQTIRIKVHLDAPIIHATTFQVYSDKHQKSMVHMIAALAYDGVTYLIDSLGDYVVFNGPDKTRAFTAGNFSCIPSTNATAPCLIYLTCDDRVAVYPNITIPFTAILGFRGRIDASLAKEIGGIQQLVAAHNMPTRQARIITELLYQPWDL